MKEKKANGNYLAYCDGEDRKPIAKFWGKETKC
jgi:hypothetical protein